MDIQLPDLHFQPFSVNYKRCGCYIRNPHLIQNVKPQTHVSMPLKHIDYDIQVTNGLVSTTLQQTYLNPTQKFLQIDFSFPIDPKACIYKFVAQFGNKRIQGVVKQKQQAKKEYQQAVKQGKQAVYAQIDPNSKDIMNMQIGNLGPKEQVKITISYLQELNIQQNTFYQLHLSSTISPRYMNSHSGQLFAQNVKSVKGNYTWTFKITLSTSRKLVYYISHSHQLTLLSQNEAQTQTILCLAKQQKPNVDLFLLFTVENFHLPNYVLGRTDNSCTAMLSFIPKFCELSLDDAMKASMVKKQIQTDMSAAKGQYIFLLDRSGSMGGSRIQKAKQALILFLQSLPQNTYFNVISFGDRYNFMFKSSVKYNNQNLNNAVGQINKMRADMGGTQIYAALQTLLQAKTIDGYPKQIFLLTDGGVSNTDGVIALVGKSIKYSRCHSIGIGNGCSEALIKGCAQKGKGKYIFIQDSENPSQKIITLLEQTLTPVIENISLKYEKDLVQSIVPNPQSLPYILKNQVVNFYITFKGQLQKSTSFTFGYKDSMNKTPFQSIMQINPQSHNMPFVDKMAHNKIIKNLQQAAKQNKSVQQYMYYVKVVDKKKQAINHSVKYQILSQYTAFICVDKELVDGKFQQIKEKGTDKIKIQPMIPQNILQRGQKLQDLCIKSSNLICSSQSFGMRASSPPQMKNAIRDVAAKKKSSGGFLGAVVNGITGLFAGKKQQSKPQPVMAQQKIIPIKAPTMKMMDAPMKMAQKCIPPPSMNFNMKLSAPMRKRNIKAEKQQQQIQQQRQNKMCRNLDFQQDMDDGNEMIKQLMTSVKSQKKQVQRVRAKMNQQPEQDEYDINDFMAQLTMDQCAMEKQECKQMQSPKKQKKAKTQSSLQTINKDKKESPIKVVSISIQNVIKLQNVDGSFVTEDLLKQLYPAKYNQIIQQLKNKNIDIGLGITYAVAKWIQLNHPSKQYALIVKKAYSFIKKSTKLEDLAFLDQLLA